MRLCDNLLNLRKQRHMTQLDLAQRCGVSQALISAIEKGTRMPSMENLENLAKGLNVPLLLKRNKE